MKPTRKCAKCNTVKNLTDFYRCRTKPLGREHTCKECKCAYQKAQIRKKKIYASTVWPKDADTSIYIEKQCDVCYALFLPRNKYQTNCSLCTEIYTNVYRKISTVCSKWGDNSQPQREKIARNIVAYAARTYLESTNCCYCGRAYTDGNVKSFDHIIPRSQEGKTTIDNIAICCLECNRSKGSLSLSEWQNICLLVSNKIGNIQSSPSLGTSGCILSRIE